MPHLDYAHHFWKSHVKPGDVVIDATCGNGHDTMLLAQLALTPNSGKVISIDRQAEAIQKTQHRLQTTLSADIYHRIQFIHGCHSYLPVMEKSVSLVVYNLGYLPGGNKAITTTTETTLQSIQNALTTLSQHGAISITCYPGHPEGKKEELAILEFVASLDEMRWTCSHQRWVNRHQNAPSVLIIHNK